MKAKEFMNETTSAGAVAAVAMPLGAVQSRKPKKKNKTTKEKKIVNCAVIDRISRTSSSNSSRDHSYTRKNRVQSW